MMTPRRDENRRFVRHDLYGSIPMVRRTAAGTDGRTYEWWEYDGTHRPPVPSYAVAGDPSKQVFCPIHHVPKYFYVDSDRECVQCGHTFTFRASEQRFWYESLQFNFNSAAIRCPSCRKLRRSTRALHEQVTTAREALKKDPEDPGRTLALAEALVRYHQRTGDGRLEDAIAAAKATQRLWPSAAEAWFWEGAAHHLAGHDQKARRVLTTFLQSPSVVRRRLKTLAAEARQWLEQGSRAV